MSDINEEFFQAVRAGDAKMINKLLNRGADIHFMDDCALLWCIQFDMTKIARLLLENGANANPEQEPCDLSPLLRVIHNNNLELLSALLKYNADINAENGVALRLNVNYVRRNSNKRAEMMAKLLEPGTERCSAGAVSSECPVGFSSLKHGADVYCNDKSILVDLEKDFDEAIADLLLPYCDTEDWHYFPDAYIKKKVVATKGARNI